MAENSARESSVPMLHMHPAQILNTRFNFTYVRVESSGGATPGHARSIELAGRSTTLAPPCVLLCFGNSVNRK